MRFLWEVQEFAQKISAFKNSLNSLLTLMSVARYNGYDHFEALSTAELSRICFDRASQDPHDMPLAKNSMTWKHPVAPENGSFPMCLPTHLPKENLIRFHHIHARET